jgi:hypothetical protein
MQLPSGHSVRETELGDLPTLCSVKIQRPAVSTRANSRSYTLYSASASEVLGYLEILFGHDASLQPSPTDAVVTVFCSKATGAAESEFEFLDAVAKHLARYGYTRLLALPDSDPALLSLGFTESGSDWVFSGTAVAVAAPVQRTSSLPAFNLADGSRVLRARITDLDLASYKCAPSSFVGTGPGSFAYVQLDLAGRPAAYFETDDNNVVTGLCGDFARLFVVIKEVMLLRGVKTLLVSPEVVTPERTQMMRDLGFELRDDVYSLRMTKKYVRTEREQAQEYLHEVYLQMCRLEEDGKKKLRRLVKAVSETELKKLLKSRGLSTRVLPDEHLSDRVLELLEDEARAFCGQDKEDQDQVRPELVALGVAVMQLAVAEGDESRWGALKRGLIKYARQMIKYLWESVQWVGQKVLDVGKGTLQILRQVFTMCTNTAYAAGACYSAMTYMCTFINPMVSQIKDAAITGGPAPSDLVDSAYATVYEYMIKALGVLCSFFPGERPKASKEAIADAVARSNRGEPIPDDIKQLLAQEQKEHESSWWAAIGWAGLSNKQQVVHDTCLAQTSHPPFVESMDECQARNFHALEVEKKSQSPRETTATATVKRR